MNTKIEGKAALLSMGQEDLFNLLSNPANFEKIMPEEVVKFEAGDTWFIFGLKGLPEVKLKVSESVPNEKIVLKSASDKLNFQLVGHLKSQGASTEVNLSFEGDFNPMLKMMIERPLKNFIEKLSNNLTKLES